MLVPRCEGSGLGKIEFYLPKVAFILITWSLNGELMKEDLNFHLQVIAQFSAEVVFVMPVL